ncbi:MAG: ribosome small subunit-dependent GTPase A [Ruminococcaceae bacterium]|nr:ribosome small subunit-dependent GTPase A [Oscillospiraceae bacterium]
MDNVLKGRIIKGIGGFYYVDTESGVKVCRARGRFRKTGEMPYVGDVVSIGMQHDDSGYILEIEKRTNFMIRPPIANIDMIVIVASKAPPVTDIHFIDRIMVLAEHKKIEVCIAVNKCDECFGDEIFNVYKDTGAKVFRVSAKNGDGVEELKAFLKGKFTAFTGNSGVGKSTLINALLPTANLETGEINVKIGRGKHTTRQVEVLKLNEDSWIADTPGFSVFDVTSDNGILAENLKELFPEFNEFEGKCKFFGCAHIKESGCALIDAVESGIIQRSRYESYKKLFEELKALPKYR